MNQDDRYTSEKASRSQQIADKYRRKAADRAGTSSSGRAARISGATRQGSGRSAGSVRRSSASGARRSSASRRAAYRSITFSDVLSGWLEDRRFLIISGIAAALLIIFVISRLFASPGRGKNQTEPVPETTTQEETMEQTTEEPPFVLGSYYDSMQPAVALTFDDGPQKGTTDAILDVLEQYKAHATFFMIGQNVQNDPEDVARMVELGCELGNHTWSHKRLTTMSASEREADFLKTNQAIQEASGGTPVTVIRPPWGASDKEIRDELPIPIIIWNLDTLDWDTRNASMTIQSVRDGVKGGDIVLMHDIHESTVEAVKTLVPLLIEQGYRLLTVSELYEYYGEELTLHLGHAYAEPQPQATAPAEAAAPAEATTEDPDADSAG